MEQKNCINDSSLEMEEENCDYAYIELDGNIIDRIEIPKTDKSNLKS